MRADVAGNKFPHLRVDFAGTNLLTHMHMHTYTHTDIHTYMFFSVFGVLGVFGVFGVFGLGAEEL